MRVARDHGSRLPVAHALHDGLGDPVAQRERRHGVAQRVERHAVGVLAAVDEPSSAHDVRESPLDRRARAAPARPREQVGACELGDRRELGRDQLQGLVLERPGEPAAVLRGLGQQVRSAAAVDLQARSAQRADLPEAHPRHRAESEDRSEPGGRRGGDRLQLLEAEPARARVVDAESLHAAALGRVHVNPPPAVAVGQERRQLRERLVPARRRPAPRLGPARKLRLDLLRGNRPHVAALEHQTPPQPWAEPAFVVERAEDPVAVVHPSLRPSILEVQLCGPLKQDAGRRRLGLRVELGRVEVTGRDAPADSVERVLRLLVILAGRPAVPLLLVVEVDPVAPSAFEHGHGSPRLRFKVSDLPI